MVMKSDQEIGGSPVGNCAPRVRFNGISDISSKDCETFHNNPSGLDFVLCSPKLELHSADWMRRLVKGTDNEI
jgi:hypothetical protein